MSKTSLGQVIDATEGVFLPAALLPFFERFNNAAQLAIIYKTLHFLTYGSEEGRFMVRNFDGVPWRNCNYAYISQRCHGWVSERSMRRLVPQLIEEGYVKREERVNMGVKEYWYAVNRDVTL